MTSKGLYQKYVILHADGTEINGRAFVLRPDRDPVAWHALKHYALSTPNRKLARDIREWLASIGMPEEE